MNQKVKRYVQILLASAEGEFNRQDAQSAWKWLELAHVFSQPYAGMHTLVHWRMLKYAMRSGDSREIIGQLLRLIVAAPGSWTGKFPVGNTGRSNVSMFQEMEIPKNVADRLIELEQTKNKRGTVMKNNLLSVGLLLAIVVMGDFAFAHGGDVEAPKDKPKAEPVRRAPRGPEALNENDLPKISAQKSLPEDVVTIVCKLGEFTPCRGIEVSLNDLSGKKIAVAHTGTSGTAAFEGLKSGTTYIARIESEKYAGEVRLRSGNAWSLIGERR